jgi:hypothetical protein
VAIAALFLFSLRRAVDWTSSDVRYQVGAMKGALWVGWRPEGWQRESDPHAGVSGWGVAEFLGAEFIWGIEHTRGRTWESLTISLWIPFAVCLVPTAVLWYWGRAATRASWRRWRDRVRPGRRQRVTFWLVVGFCVLHVLLLVSAVPACDSVIGFSFPPAVGSGGPLESLELFTLPILFWGTPLWGTLWAWLWVRLRNRQLSKRRGEICLECGYLLVGNVSGRCPECGAKVETAAE